MRPHRLAIGISAGLLAMLTLGGAQPLALAQTHGGLWEISGAPGANAPIKQCIANVAALAEFEHRGKNCAPKVISSSASAMLIEYSCGAAGFGRSQVDVITPRSLRIETQGISQQLPFRYVLQVRRIGDCQQQASRH